MSYIKQDFKSKETLYASQLNAMDEQIYINESSIAELNEKVDSISSNQVNPDYNQNDETAADYIKNRPFYEYNEVLVDTVTVNNGDTIDTTSYNDGDVVIVIWDGVSIEQTVKCCDFKVGRWAMKYNAIGNQSYLNNGENTFENTGEEFLIYYTVGVAAPTSTIICDENPHTLSIIKYIIVEIDDKFLPNIWKGAGEGALVFNSDINAASGNYSHAEGYNTKASGAFSHAEGYNTKASVASHAEGCDTTASGQNSHAEGYLTTASGNYSHTEGGWTKASGLYSHTEGYYTTASGANSHTEGSWTKATRKSQNVIGEYNEYEPEGYFLSINNMYVNDLIPDAYVCGDSYTIDQLTGTITINNATTTSGLAINTYVYPNVDIENGQYSYIYKVSSIDTENSKYSYYRCSSISYGSEKGNYIHIIGNGTSSTNRSNAHTLDWDGNAEYAGDVIANACGGENPISLVEVAERTKAIEGIDLDNVIYYEEVTEDNEEDVISALCFDQLSLSSDGTYVYLKFGNTVLSKVKVDGVGGSSENENLYITGVSFKAGGTWYSSSDTTEILYVSINGSRGCSQYNGEDVVIPIEASTTYTVDFSGIDNSNYIVGYAITNADGYRIVDSGWLSSQTATFTTPGDAHGLTLNFKYGSAGSTSITTEMAQALTDALTIKKEAA